MANSESCRKALQSRENPYNNSSLLQYVFYAKERNNGTNNKRRDELFDPDKDINSQADLLTYNPRREIERSSFTITKKLGSGNFGTVSKGVLTGLYGNNSKTTVAIKRTIGPAEGSDLRDFLQEIKIMGYIKPHLNLVSMIGSCASDLDNEKEMWLIIEFCEYGDLKNFLIENKNKILSGSKEDNINDRCLMHWIYDIGKGMEFLSSNKIMHGDLAARNVMIDENVVKSGRLMAKVSFFFIS